MSARLEPTLRGWGRVLVEGNSMLPTLRSGDRCLVRWGAPLRLGDVVVARRPDRPDRPDLLVIKRLTAREADGAWLEGDNRDGSHDSWVFGAVAEVDLLGVVRMRYRPRPSRIARAVGL